MKHYSIIKIRKLPFVTCVNLKDLMLDEISQTQKDKNCVISPTYGI